MRRRSPLALATRLAASVFLVFSGSSCGSSSGGSGSDDPVEVATNQAPFAFAGDDVTAEVGTTVPLDGAMSSDADGDALTYEWLVVFLPAGSLAELFDATAVNPMLTPDIPGDYVLDLFVSDGQTVSAPAQVTITATAPPAPPAPIEAPQDEAPGVGEVLWVDRDISRWPQTADLRSVRTTGPEPRRDQIVFDWDRTSWDDDQVRIFGDGAYAVGNPWFIVKVGGRWVGSAFTWLRPSQDRKPLHELTDPTIRQGPLAGWKPEPGDEFYILISGLARSGQSNTQERTNMVKFVMPNFHPGHD